MHNKNLLDLNNILIFCYASTGIGLDPSLLEFRLTFITLYLTRQFAFTLWFRFLFYLAIIGPFSCEVL
jgi:hypothetical protein